MKVPETAIFQGELLGLSEGVLYGWAYNYVQPDEKVVVEIYLDDHPFQLVRADACFDGVQVGDGSHGFYLHLPETKLSHVQTIRALVANSKVWLQGVVQPSLPDAPKPPLLGWVFNHHGLRCQGWVWDLAVPHQAMVVRFYQGSQLLGETLANQLDNDLMTRGIGDGRHAFSYTLPLALADGKPHEIRVYDGQNRALPGSPLTVVSFADAFTAPDGDDFLAKLLRHYQYHVPSSLDFALYKEWFGRFGQAIPSETSATSFLVVVFGSGDSKVTIQSLLAQTHANVRILMAGNAMSNDPRVEMVLPTLWPAVLAQRIQQQRVPWP
jgi:O-antigen biosynthesis protein